MIRTLLLEHGAKPLDHRNPLAAARANDVAALRSMAVAGADLSAAHDGLTPLMGAAADGHGAAAELLLELGVDLDVVTSYSALHVAISNQRWAILDALLQAGADCSVVDNHANQPLAALLFSKGATTERLRQMLALGADSRHQARSGTSPLDFVRQLDDRSEWVELLASVPVGDAPDALAYRPRSKVLERASGNSTANWKRLHTELWDELVPPSGPAPSVQGELLRCIGKLTDEAYRNGNCNWGPHLVALVDTLEEFLFDGTLGPEREAALRPLVRALRHSRNPDLRGDGSAHYRVSEAVVEWCLARPELVVRAG